MSYLLGIDAGTSNVKAVLFDADGAEIAVADRKSETFHVENNGVEQDMETVWQNAMECLREITARCPKECQELAAIGVTGQGEGFWAVDRSGAPVQRALLWCDGRAVDEVTDLTERQPELGQSYHSTTGTPPLTGNQLILTRWMMHNRPEVLEKVHTVLFCKDWIRYRLTGVLAADVTDSMTSLLDARSLDPALELMESLGINRGGELFPKPLRSDETAGTLLDSLAEELGLPKGLPVIAGALDTSATLIGLGAVSAGDTAVILGTTCACEVVLEQSACQGRFGEPGTRYEKHPLKDLYVNLQPTLNGTPNINWMLNTIAGTHDFNEIDRMISASHPGSSGVIYLPYIGLAGERAPFYHPYARAEFFGMSMVTTREDLVRAVYEGISLSIRDCLTTDGGSGPVYLAGGGTKSAVWSQMIADVLGREIRVPSGRELGAKGAALMAGVNQGVYRDYREAVSRGCSFRSVYHPDPARAELYTELFGLYRDLRESSGEFWNRRHRINKQLKKYIKQTKQQGE